MRLSVFSLVTMATLSACSDAAPCGNCPPVDGTYAVSWADGGTVVGDAGCGGAGPRPATWKLAQRTASQISTTVGEVTLGGTLYDTYELVLSGSSSGLTYRLRATAIPTGTSADAGMSLNGNFTSRTLPSSGEPCEVTEAFTAQRTSR